MEPVLKRPASEEVKKIALKASDLYANERAEEAFELLQKTVHLHNHARLWRLLARMRIFFGDETGASEILTHILPAVWKPGFWELAQAGSKLGYAVKSEQHKLLYFPVRKCACTSMYNFMAQIDGGEAQGEDIHDGQAHTLIDYGSLRTDYGEYQTILIVRDPVARVRSFYKGNIEKREHLVIDTKGRDSFYGLKTKPTYEDFLANFDAYRRTFITVRNHTDPLIAFAGTDTGCFDHILNVAEVSGFQEKMARLLDVNLLPSHEMKSGAIMDESPAEASIKGLYEEDYRLFGQYF